MSVEQQLPLLQFLAGLPEKLDYSITKRSLLEGNVKRALNFALSHIITKEIANGNGNKGNANTKYTEKDYTPLVFPGLDKSKFPTDWDTDVLQLPLLSKGQFFKDVHQYYNNEAKNSSLNNKNSKKLMNPVHRGRPCGRKFKFGEPLYRCVQCGFDNTCVLCVHCFNKDDHEGHVIETNISQDNSGGCCDCGDPEAWNNELHCMCEVRAKQEEANRKSGDSKQEEEQEERTRDGLRISDKEFQDNLHSLIKTCLCYIVGTFGYSTETLPFFVRSIKFYDRFDFYQKLSDHSRHSWLDDNFRIKPKASEKYVLLLWNDEEHPYDYAASTIRKASKCSASRSEQIAIKIDSEGRDVLLVSDQPMELYDTYCEIHVPSRVCDEGLVPSIMDLQGFLQEEICFYIANWIQELLEHPNDKLLSLVREHLVKVMLEKLPISADDEFYEFNNKRDRIVRGLLTTDGQIPKYQFSVDLSEYDVNDDEKKQNEPEMNSIVEYLLYFDIRYMKKLRKEMHSLIVESLVTNLDFKNKFLLKYINLYPYLLKQMTFDREFNYTIMFDVAVQLFSAPSAAITLAIKGLFHRVLLGIYELFRERTRPNGKWKEPEYVVPNSKVAIKRYLRTIKRGLQDLMYLVDKLPEKYKIYFYTPKNMLVVIQLLSMFQSSYLVRRKIGEHVSVESKSHLVLIEMLDPILKVLTTMFNGKEFSTSNAEGAIEDNVGLVKQALQLVRDEYWNTISPPQAEVVELFGQNYQVNSFKVSSDEVGILNPLNTLFSILLENNDLKLLQQNSDNFIEELSVVAEVSLRTIVFCGQVSARLWVRNGMSILFLQSVYSQLALGANFSAHGYMRDIHLNQMYFYFAPDPQNVLVNVIDRWELLNWVKGTESHQQTIYGDKFQFLIYEFFLFFYRLVTERKFFIPQTSQQKTKNSILYVVIYSLSTGPLTYMDISEEIRVEDTGTLIRDVLNEVADYKPPVGLNDSGTFSLKEKYFHELDPFSMFSSSVEEVFVAVRNKLFRIEQQRAKREGTSCKYKDIDDVILKPSFASLENKEEGENSAEGYQKYTDFIRTDIFNKVICKGFEVFIKTANDHNLQLLLHLTHAVFLDNENVKGKEYFPESYAVIINQLFSIVQHPKLYKVSKAKAFYLLQYLIKTHENKVYDQLEAEFSTQSVQDFKTSLDKTHQDEEKAKRRKLIEEKKKRAFEKLAAQRRKFEQNNNIKRQQRDIDVDDPNSKAKAGSPSALAAEGNDDDSDAEMEDESHNHGAKTCILCQREQNLDEVFVVIANCVEHDAFWNLPSDETLFKQAFNDWDNSVGLKEFIDKEGKIFPFQEKITAPVPAAALGDSASSDNVVESRSLVDTRNIIVSCNHAIHYKCLTQIAGESLGGNLTCPLCQFTGSIVIPCLLSEKLKADVFDHLFKNKDTEESSENIDEFLSWYNGLTKEDKDLEENASSITAFKNKNPEIWQTLISEENYNKIAHTHSRYHAAYHHVAHRACVVLSSVNNVDAVTSLSQMISNTIATLELASRFSSDEPYSQYLSEIPEITYAFLRTLIQFRVSLDIEGIAPPMRNSINKQKQQVLPPQPTFIRGFLSGVFSFRMMFDVAYTRNIASTIKGVFNRISDHSILFETIGAMGAKHFKKITDRDSLDQLKQVLSKIINPSTQSLTGLEDDFINGLVLILERCLLGFFRQMTIFIKALTFDINSTNVFYQIDNIINDQVIGPIENSLYDEDYPQTLESYYKFFNVPNVLEVLKLLNRETDFYLKIFKRVFDNGNDTKFEFVDYPGIVKLLPLPERLDSFSIEAQKLFEILSSRSEEDREIYSRDLKHRADYVICLHCGKQIYDNKKDKFSMVAPMESKMKEHANDKSLGRHCLFLSPNENHLSLITSTHGIFSYPLVMNAPYINNLGESGQRALHQASLVTLSEKRYRNIIKNWLVDRYYSYASRMVSSTRFRNFADAFANFGAEGQEDDDEADTAGPLFGAATAAMVAGEVDDGDDNEDEDDDEGAMAEGEPIILGPRAGFTRPGGPVFRRFTIDPEPNVDESDEERDMDDVDAEEEEDMFVPTRRAFANIFGGAGAGARAGGGIGRFDDDDDYDEEIEFDEDEEDPNTRQAMRQFREGLLFGGGNGMFHDLRQIADLAERANAGRANANANAEVDDDDDENQTEARAGGRTDLSRRMESQLAEQIELARLFNNGYAMGIDQDHLNRLPEIAEALFANQASVSSDDDGDDGDEDDGNDDDGNDDDFTDAHSHDVDEIDDDYNDESDDYDDDGEHEIDMTY